MLRFARPDLFDLVALDVAWHGLAHLRWQPVEKRFVGESGAKIIRPENRVAGISDICLRFDDAELVKFDRSQPE